MMGDISMAAYSDKPGQMVVATEPRWNEVVHVHRQPLVTIPRVGDLVNVCNRLRVPLSTCGREKTGGISFAVHRWSAGRETLHGGFIDAFRLSRIRSAFHWATASALH